MPRNSQRSRNNNNPEGHNQYSNGWLDTARERPFVAAATAAAAVGTGIFLWSRRNEISDQISELSNQIGDWASEMRSGNGRELELTGGPNESSAIESSRSTGRSSANRARSTGRSRPASSGSSPETNQTTGGRSQGENTTF